METYYLCNYCNETFEDFNYFENLKIQFRKKEIWKEVIKKIVNNNENTDNSESEDSNSTNSEISEDETDIYYGIKGMNYFIDYNDFDLVEGSLFPINHVLDSGIIPIYLNIFFKNLFFTSAGTFEKQFFEKFKQVYNMIVGKNENLKWKTKKLDSNFEKFLRNKKTMNKYKSKEIELMLDIIPLVLKIISKFKLRNNKYYEYEEFKNTIEFKEFLTIKRYYKLLNQRDIKFDQFENEFNILHKDYIIMIKKYKKLQIYKSHSIVHIPKLIKIQGTIKINEYGGEKMIHYSVGEKSSSSPNKCLSNMINIYNNKNYLIKFETQIKYETSKREENLNNFIYKDNDIFKSVNITTSSEVDFIKIHIYILKKDSYIEYYLNNKNYYSKIDNIYKINEKIYFKVTILKIFKSLDENFEMIENTKEFGIINIEIIKNILIVYNNLIWTKFEITLK